MDCELIRWNCGLHRRNLYNAHGGLNRVHRRLKPYRHNVAQSTHYTTQSGKVARHFCTVNRKSGRWTVDKTVDG